jgi:hypothetical protein
MENVKAAVPEGWAEIAVGNEKLNTHKLIWRHVLDLITIMKFPGMY